MALVTKTLAVISDEGINAVVELDYDDVALTLVTVRCINPTARALVVSGVATSTGRSFSRTFAAGQTTEQAIPQQQAQKLDITINPQGRLGGVEYQIRWAP